VLVLVVVLLLMADILGKVAAAAEVSALESCTGAGGGESGGVLSVPSPNPNPDRVVGEVGTRLGGDSCSLLVSSSAGDGFDTPPPSPSRFDLSSLIMGTDTCEWSAWMCGCVGVGVRVRADDVDEWRGGQGEREK
jgi:hypothetical protein